MDLKLLEKYKDIEKSRDVVKDAFMADFEALAGFPVVDSFTITKDKEVALVLSSSMRMICFRKKVKEGLLGKGYKVKGL